MARKDFNISAKLSHIALHVSDICASIEFYREWLGMEVISIRHNEQNEQVAFMGFKNLEDDMYLVLISGGTAASNEGQRHIGFDVEQRRDILDMAEKAGKAGILHWPAKEHNFGMLCSITDPDGHIIEFIESRSWDLEFTNDNTVRKNAKKLGK